MGTFSFEAVLLPNSEHYLGARSLIRSHQLPESRCFGSKLSSPSSTPALLRPPHTLPTISVIPSSRTGLRELYTMKCPQYAATPHYARTIDRTLDLPQKRLGRRIFRRIVRTLSFLAAVRTAYAKPPTRELLPVDLPPRDPNLCAPASNWSTLILSPARRDLFTFSYTAALTLPWTLRHLHCLYPAHPCLHRLLNPETAARQARSILL